MTRPSKRLRRLAVNWPVIEQRRIAAGLTRTELAQRVGATAPTGPSRLWRDDDRDRIPLGQLERLCAVLDPARSNYSPPAATPTPATASTPTRRR